jgi:hypothetical protein
MMDDRIKIEYKHIIRGCFKISFSENFYIAVTQFKNFETSIAILLKQALLGHFEKISYEVLMYKLVTNLSFFKCIDLLCVSMQIIKLS